MDMKISESEWQYYVDQFCYEGEGIKSHSNLVPTPEMPLGGHACCPSVIGGWMAYFALPFSKTRAAAASLLLPSVRRINWVRSRPNCGKSSGPFRSSHCYFALNKEGRRPPRKAKRRKTQLGRLTHEILPSAKAGNTENLGYVGDQ